MNKEKYINDAMKKSRIRNDGRRHYKRKPFAYFIWNLYHPNDPVKKGDVIHHKNEDILDDDIDNLEKMKFGRHSSLHHKNKIVSIKTRKKMSKAVTGKKHSEETKKKIRESSRCPSGSDHPMYGKKHSEETRKRISKALAGSNNPMYGKKHSEEIKRKMSISKLRRRKGG
jgi:hypothetical protein